MKYIRNELKPNFEHRNRHAIKSYIYMGSHKRSIKDLLVLILHANNKCNTAHPVKIYAPSLHELEFYSQFEKRTLAEPIIKRGGLGP